MRPAIAQIRSTPPHLFSDMPFPPFGLLPFPDKKRPGEAFPPGPASGFPVSRPIKYIIHIFLIYSIAYFQKMSRKNFTGRGLPDKKSADRFTGCALGYFIPSVSAYSGSGGSRWGPDGRHGAAWDGAAYAPPARFRAQGPPLRSERRGGTGSACPCRRC